MAHLDMTGLALFAGALLVAGLAGGVIAGLLGVGGGIVIVPVLYHIFTGLGVDESVRMPLAIGTSLATIIPTAIRSNISHRKRGAVDDALLRSWLFPVVGGAIAGSVVAHAIGAVGLTLIFASLASIVAIYMAVGHETWRLGEGLPSGPGRIGLAGGIGFFSTLMGIGGGTFGVPIMTLFGMPIHRAVGTSSGLGLMIGIPGAIGFILLGLHAPLRPPLSLGYVSLLGFALISPLVWFSVPWGAALAHRLSRKALMRAFALFLGFTSIKMFLSVFT